MKAYVNPIITISRIKNVKTSTSVSVEINCSPDIVKKRKKLPETIIAENAKKRNNQVA